ncbi:MAG: PepSY domain-containing protein [Gammaproteobacteria bacterium]
MYRQSKSSILAITLATSFLAVSAVQAAKTGAPVAVERNAKAYTGEELARDAKITLVEARAIAVKAHPGTIADEELEVEGGGSGLRYSFDIKDASGTHEVGVDAKTGTVLENKLEGPIHD